VLFILQAERKRIDSLRVSGARAFMERDHYQRIESTASDMRLLAVTTVAGKNRVLVRLPSMGN
jgi:hypothetical protein